MSSGQPQGERLGNVRLSDFITMDNRFLCLKMRGLPYSADVR
jgi:hypothetical protein